jgi:sec-independent protein translocase protein TatA
MPLPSGFEWVLIIGLALLILGPGKLPEVAASLGKSIREFRKASSDMTEATRIDTTPLPPPAAPAPTPQPPAPVTTAPTVPAPPAVAPDPAADETADRTS